MVPVHVACEEMKPNLEKSFIKPKSDPSVFADIKAFTKCSCRDFAIFTKFSHWVSATSGGLPGLLSSKTFSLPLLNCATQS